MNWWERYLSINHYWSGLERESECVNWLFFFFLNSSSNFCSLRGQLTSSHVEIMYIYLSAKKFSIVKEFPIFLSVYKGSPKLGLSERRGRPWIQPNPSKLAFSRILLHCLDPELLFCFFFFLFENTLWKMTENSPSSREKLWRQCRERCLLQPRTGAVLMQFPHEVIFHLLNSCCAL